LVTPTKTEITEIEIKKKINKQIRKKNNQKIEVMMIIK
jgi:hypothetical protein